MNAVTPFASHGYGTSIMRTDRDAEYDIISRVTHLLRCAADGNLGPERIAAVHKNNEMWTILATDLAGPRNALPDEVKAGLLSLAAFSLRHGHQTLAGTARIEPLIDINMALMRGLRHEAAT